MIDLKILRENPDRVRDAIRKKKFDCDIEGILELDKKRRAIITETEHLRAAHNTANSAVAKLKKGSPEFLENVKDLKSLAAKVKESQNRMHECEDAWRQAVLTIPNLPHDSVPEGVKEVDNQVLHTWGETDEDFPNARPHYDIPWFNEMVDLPRGAKVAGAAFPIFVGPMAALVRAILQFYLDEAIRAGYVELMPPLLVNAASATATGQLPDKEGQMYHLAQDDLYLIPTSEVPVTNFYRDEIFESGALPVYHCASTPCFRREAGSHGKDVRGLNRLHQFDKVELVKWVHPDKSYEELEKLREDAERLLQKLRLPYRRLLMCAGEIGFANAKQYDLEVWAAGQKRWLEVSSCSNFTDFQARRANIRFRDKDGKPRPVHTLNGSGLAVPRVLAAILENNLQKDGRVKIPEVLRERMGCDSIGTES